MKVLYHIDNASKWKLTMENAKNMLDEGEKSGENFEIEILANSIAVVNLKEQIAINTKLYMQMDELIKRNVKFAACKKALTKFTIQQEELCAFVQIVPSGVVEVANKENEGYCYIKA
ncbi:DsrE family protein [Hathewaya limosa]|uniref:Intracellular sulfur oxidation DsrE/DsrF family protein n=1 Tax=Hathewaya limosa TaxID=1536 RepID=A0ABU0JS19_HATLI|nr:DsrE family protein [Hathewaya limosa]MDQ0479870.1 intracellular sulfur oxidation DsrE/DsrF family protein [Hathewaya limosa]